MAKSDFLFDAIFSCCCWQRPHPQPTYWSAQKSRRQRSQPWIAVIRLMDEGAWKDLIRSIDKTGGLKRFAASALFLFLFSPTTQNFLTQAWLSLPLLQFRQSSVKACSTTWATIYWLFPILIWKWYFSCWFSSILRPNIPQSCGLNPQEQTLNPAFQCSNCSARIFSSTIVMQQFCCNNCTITLGKKT